MCISRLSLYHDTHGDACRPVITASTRPLQLALSCYCRIIVPTPPPHKATYPLNTAAQCSLADPCRALSIMCKPTALAFHSGSLQAPPAPCTVLRFLRRLLHAVSSSGAISSYDELSPLIVRCLLGAALSPTCSVLAALPPAPSSRRLLRSRPVLRRLLRAASPALPRLQASCILLRCFYYCAASQSKRVLSPPAPFLLQSSAPCLLRCLLQSLALCFLQSPPQSPRCVFSGRPPHRAPSRLVVQC